MLTPDLPSSNAGSRRIRFTHASAQLLAQALTDADGRRERQFPTLRSATWNEVLHQLQPDVLVLDGGATFDWHGLARWVQGLALDSERPALASLDGELTAAELTVEEELRAYRHQAVAALAEMQANQQTYGPLTHALLMELAHGHPLVAPAGNAAENVRQDPADMECPPAPEPFVQLPVPAKETVTVQKGARPELALAPRRSKAVAKNTPGPVLRRKRAKQRTFRDIVEHHPRGNGKFGFTVRELCAIMRVSAASLTEARKNPGHLSVEKVMALAEAMEEHPLRVLGDLMTEAASKKRRLRKKRITLPQPLANDAVR